MKFLLTISALLLFVFQSCKETEKKAIAKKTTIDSHWLDSVKKSCDTFYIKPYGRNPDFATGEYYFNRKDTIVCQFMKDSAGTIRQAIIAKKNIYRLHFSEYYANGQLKALYQFDDSGRYNGPGAFYHPNGFVKSEGEYNHGFYSGAWKNYNDKGEIQSTDQYDANGQLISNKKE